jgi:hypothetical protein
VPEPAAYEFEGEDGFTMEGGVSPCGWGVLESPLATSGTSLLYYGDPVAMNFDCGEQVGSALSPPFDLTPGVGHQLRFDLRMSTESGLTYDQLRALAVLPDGSELVIWEKDGTEQTNLLETKTASLTGLGGQTVSIRFLFDTVDGVANTGEGVFVDHVRVVSGCLVGVCETDVDCDDLQECTLETCVEDACQSAPIAGCCEDDLGCNDSNACTSDSCVANVCEHTPIGGCCLEDAECDDGGLCTTDSCADNVCTNEWQDGCCEKNTDCGDGDLCTSDSCPEPGGACLNEVIELCCTTAVDCDDGIGCTLDICQDHACVMVDSCCAVDADCDDEQDCSLDVCDAGSCVQEWPDDPSCCAPEPVFWSFEEPVLLETSATSPLCGWQVVTTDQAQSGSFALYYGDSDAWNFDCGASSGAATTPWIVLPTPGYAYTLSFKLAMFTEASTNYDQLHVWAVLEDGNEVLLWDKTGLDGNDAWQSIEANLSAIGGTSFKLRFDFNTVDQIANATLGVFIDDILVTSQCGPTACEDATTCDDGFAWSTDTCENGECAYASQ